MLFHLYTNNSEKNAIRKALVGMGSFTGNLLAETSVVHPVFMIEAEDLRDINYLSCLDLHRSYFIDDIMSVRYNLWRVSCTVDVLSTYMEQILDLECIVERQEALEHANVFLDDGVFVADSRAPIETIEFPEGFPDKPYLVLVTTGKPDAEPPSSK